MTIALTAARIFDGKSDRIEKGGVVLIEGEEIAASGPDLRIPPGAERIDLGDVTLGPGFIDAHTHLTVEAKSYSEFFIDRFRSHVAEKAYQAAVLDFASQLLLVSATACPHPTSPRSTFMCLIRHMIRRAVLHITQFDLVGAHSNVFQ